jgi:RNA polymerase sigma-70 factor (ECF subfamily)
LRPSTQKRRGGLASVHRLLPVEIGDERGGDRALLAALHDRHPSAAAVLFDRFARPVERTLVRILGRDSDVADLLNDVFLRAVQRIDRVVDADALGMWLTRIAVYTAREHIAARRRRRWLLFFGSHDLPEREATQASPDMRQAVAHLYRVLDELPVDDRLAFSLRYLEEMDLTEVADACGVSLATAKRRLARAEKRFVAMSRRDPVLSAWLEGGLRWNRR